MSLKTELFRFLVRIPQTDKVEQRKTLLSLVGFGRWNDRLTQADNKIVFFNELLELLRSEGQESLSKFLRELADPGLNCVGLEQRQTLIAFSQQVSALTPDRWNQEFWEIPDDAPVPVTNLTADNTIAAIAPLPPIPQWKGHETRQDVLEKIIGEDTLRPIAFLERGLEVARSVAYIQVQAGGKRWSGTGFLVAEDVLLTNNHVLYSSDLLLNSIFRFNYQDDFWGHAQDTDEYRAKPDGLFHTNQELDYTLVQLNGKPGEKWGWLPLSPREVICGERVNIIQHPAGRAKSVSLQNNFVEYVGKNVVQYITSTLNGSSGSPVFNDGWEVVALHHAGGNIPEPTTQRRYFRNEGILIENILLDLPLHIRQILSVPAH